MRILVVSLLAMLLPAVAPGQGFPSGNSGPKVTPTLIHIHAGRLMTVAGEPVRREQTIVVRNERIVALLDGFVPAPATDPEGARRIETIDLRDAFVLPGLMDAHVHLYLSTGPYAGQTSNGTRSRDTGENAIRALTSARLTLAAGFTTVRDLGSDPQSVFAVRDAINRNLILGPRILASGPSVSVTGGHRDESTSAQPDERARTGICDGADECRRLVRWLDKAGADLVKIKITGGFSSNTGLAQHMTLAEMQAITGAAGQRDMRVTTHAYAPQAIHDAVTAGVNSIEHGYLLDDEGIRMMKKAGTTLIPTLVVAEPPGIARRFMPKGEEPWSVTLRNENRAFERAYAAGVAIGLGTDAGIYPHGRNADELVRMVELGMTPADALRSATMVNARLFGVDADAGSIEVGKLADLIALSGDPLKDISAARSVDFVMKSGRVAKQDGRVTPDLDYSLQLEY